MGGLGAQEIILIVIVLFVFFGAKKIPEMAQGIGKGIKEFRKSMKDVQTDIETEAPNDQDKEIQRLKLELEVLKHKQEQNKKLEEHT